MAKRTCCQMVDPHVTEQPHREWLRLRPRPTAGEEGQAHVVERRPPRHAVRALKDPLDCADPSRTNRPSLGSIQPARIPSSALARARWTGEGIDVTRDEVGGDVLE